MTDTTNLMRPLLLMDVDGPLSPDRIPTVDGKPARGFVRHVMRPRGFEPLAPGDAVKRDYYADKHYLPNGMPRPKHKPGDPLYMDMHPDHGPAMVALSDVFDIVWATTWLDEANDFIGSVLGLPPNLPHIDFPTDALDKRDREGRNGSWKSPRIARWLADNHPGRAWAWVDDEVNRYDRAWFASWYEWRTSPPPHLLLRVDLNVGMKPADFDALHAWAARLVSDNGADSTFA